MNTKIKSNYLILLIMFLFVTSHVSAEDNNIGVGIVIGTPFAVTGKFIINKNSAIDFGAGKAEGDGVYIYADYIINIHYFQDIPGLIFYSGIGPAFHEFEKDNRRNNVNDDKDENRIELRIPVGLEFSFYPKYNVPVRLFGEIIPALIVSPEIDSEFRGGIGARYFF